MSPVRMSPGDEGLVDKLPKARGPQMCPSAKNDQAVVIGLKNALVSAISAFHAWRPKKQGLLPTAAHKRWLQEAFCANRQGPQHLHTLRVSVRLEKSWHRPCGAVLCLSRRRRQQFLERCTKTPGFTVQSLLCEGPLAARCSATRSPALRV